MPDDSRALPISRRGDFRRNVAPRPGLKQAFDPAVDPIDVYALDKAYWRSLWYRPP